jgi:hypothetical protein
MRRVLLLTLLFVAAATDKANGPMASCLSALGLVRSSRMCGEGALCWVQEKVAMAAFDLVRDDCCRVLTFSLATAMIVAVLLLSCCRCKPTHQLLGAAIVAAVVAGCVEVAYGGIVRLCID